MRQPQMRSPLEKGAAKGRDRLPRRGRTLQNGKDMGQHAPLNPAYYNKRDHFPIANPRFGRDSSFHFAVGLPF